jgi:hypothetical protein
LLGNLVIEISGGNFAGALSQSLDGAGNLFGEIESEPENLG